MNSEPCQVQYLPLFEQDLRETVMYIAKVLHNKQAAERLVNDVQAAIRERSFHPKMHQPYLCNSKEIYYRINIRNYAIFYVVHDDVMEVRRLLYGRRSIPDHIF